MVGWHSSELFNSDNTYDLPILQKLPEQIWYQVSIKAGAAPVTDYGLVRMRIVSSTQTLGILYDWNNGFEYYHIEQNQ